MGLLVAFCGWGTWAADGRGTNVDPFLSFAIVVLVGVGVLIICRLIGRIAFAAIFRRPRRSARLAHGLTGLYLSICGFGYLAKTSWILAGLAWLRGVR